MGCRALKKLAYLSWLAVVVGASAMAQGTIRGEVKVFTLDAQGKQIPRADRSDIVVFVTGFKEDPPSAVPMIQQKDKQFQPRVLPITMGQSVQFRNDDTVLHNVFANSVAKRFDLGKKNVGEMETIKFSKTGIVDIYCDIHEQMAMTVLVLPNKAFAVTDKDGKFVIRNVPAGEHPIRAWQIREQADARVTVTSGATTDVVLEVVESSRPPHKDKYGKEYQERKQYK